MSDSPSGASSGPSGAAETAPNASRIPRSFAAFESPPFRWLITSHLAFFLAMQGQLLVRSLLAWQLTDSELALAYVNLAIAVPMVFGSFIAGAVIDRVERRALVMLAQAVILLNEVLVLVLLMFGKLEFWHLASTSVIMGTMFPFVMPTRMAMVYALVGRDRVGNGLALQSGAMNLARVLGPAFTGAMIALVSLPAAYMAAISLYLISTVCMLMLPASYPQVRQKKSLFTDISYSFTYVADHRSILLCLIFGLFPMMLIMPVFNLLVVFADDVWQTGEAGLGMLMATLGAGGILGALWVARLGDTVRRARFMVLSTLIFAVLLAGFSVSPSFILALFLLLAANIFSNISQTLNHTIIQLLSDDEVRGRMTSLVMISFGLTPLGVLPIAFLSEIYGISITVFIACILLGLILLAFFLFSPTLRSLDARMEADMRAEAERAQAAG